MPKAWLLALPLLLWTASARADDRTGYVNLPRAINECADGKKAIADLANENAAREKAKASKAPVTSDADWNAQQQRKAQEANDRISARMMRIIPKIAEARKLTTVAAAPLYVAPRLDLTDELIRRYDAGEWTGQDKAAALAEAKAKVAALEREVKPSPKPKAPKEK